MRLRDQYDWIVLGDHPGALLTACLAARLGKSVLILSVIPSQGLKQAPHAVVLDPESNYMLGARRAGSGGSAEGVLGRCLSRLGMFPSEAEVLDSELGRAQVLTPEHRLEVTLEGSPLELELRRELGRELGAALAATVRQAEPLVLPHWNGIAERLTTGQSGASSGWGSLFPSSDARSAPASEYRAILDAVAKHLGKSGAPPKATLGTETLAELGSGVARALHFAGGGKSSLIELAHWMILSRVASGFKGGVAGYRDFLLRLARKLGAHAPGLECRRIFLEQGRFAGVQIVSKGNMIAGGSGVVGCALEHAAARSTSSGQAWRKRLKGFPVPSGWKFTLALTVRAEGIPPGATPRMLWQESQAPPLEIEIAEPASYGIQGAPDVRLVFARTVLGFTAEGISPPQQRLTAARIYRKLSEILPFLDAHVLRVYPEFRSEPGSGARPQRAASDELMEAFGFETPQAIPESLRVFNGPGLGFRSGIDSLFIVSGEAYPELGTLGPTLAAIESVAASGLGAELKTLLA